MSGTSLSITDKMRNSIAKSEARTILASLLSLGFVTINILVALEFVTTDVYGVIIIWYAPFQAVIIGFYFGSQRQSESTTPPSIDELKKQGEVLASLASNHTKLTAHVQVLADQVNRIAEKLPKE